MKPYGPITFTINTVFRVGIDAWGAAVQIHNNSGLSLRIYFGAAGAASYQTASDWHGTISPGSHPVLPIPSGYFDGTLTFFPFSEQQTATQLSGIITASNLLTIDEYYPGEGLPQSQYSPVFQQGAAQQRVLSIPMSTVDTATLLISQFSQATASPVLLSFSTIPANSVAVARQPTIGVFQCQFFLHDLALVFIGTAAGNNSVYYHIDAYVLTNAFAVRAGPVTMFHDNLGSAGGVGGRDRLVFNRSSPCPTNFVTATTVVSTDLLAVQFTVMASGGSWSIAANIGWSFDTTNRLAPLFYGGNTNEANIPPPTSAVNPNNY